MIMHGTKSVTADLALLGYSLTIDSTDGGSVPSRSDGTFTWIMSQQSLEM